MAENNWRRQFHEWSGHIQDHLRSMDGKLDRILRAVGGEHDVEAIRADLTKLSEQVQDHERKLSGN